MSDDYYKCEIDKTYENFVNSLFVTSRLINLSIPIVNKLSH